MAQKKESAGNVADIRIADQPKPKKTKNEKTRAKKNTRHKRFRIELGWRGLFGLLLVSFCLFLWMFLLGLWAGQTILLPVDAVTPSKDRVTRSETMSKSPAAIKTVP